MLRLIARSDTQLSARLVRVPSGLAAEVWPHVRYLIERAMTRGGGACSFDRTEREVLSGLQVLWLAHGDNRIEAAAVTQLVSVDNRKICIIVACGGRKRDGWLHHIAGLEEYAKAEGCSVTRIIGRKGWERVLDGYALRSVVLDKAIT